MKFNERDYEYFDYILGHKRDLMKAFDLLIKAEDFCKGANLTLISDEEFQTLKDNILKHDLSKLSPEEFYGYRYYFFTTEGEEKEANHIGLSGKYYFKNRFKEAWRHHYANNPHHPEFHNYKMSKIHMLEMCLDWVAMSLKFKNNPLDYFKDKRKKLESEFGEKIDYEYVLIILANINAIYNFN